MAMKLVKSSQWNTPVSPNTYIYSAMYRFKIHNRGDSKYLIPNFTKTGHWNIIRVTKLSFFKLNKIILCFRQIQSLIKLNHIPKNKHNFHKVHTLNISLQSHVDFYEYSYSKYPFIFFLDLERLSFIGFSITIFNFVTIVKAVFVAHFREIWQLKTLYVLLNYYFCW